MWQSSLSLVRQMFQGCFEFIGREPSSPFHYADPGTDVVDVVLHQQQSSTRRNVVFHRESEDKPSGVVSKLNNLGKWYWRKDRGSIKQFHLASQATWRKKGS